jgi:L-aspartate oxidase
MNRGGGVLRSGQSLTASASDLVDLGAGRASAATPSWEATNLLTVACTLVAAARRREETRGCHWREDFPVADDRWLGHLVARLTDEGELVHDWKVDSGPV